MMNKKSTKSLLKENPITRYLIRNGGIIVAIILVGIIISLQNDVFLTKTNLTNVLRQMTTNILLTYGMTCALLIGAIDLSVGSTVAASGCILVMLVRAEIPFAVAIIVSILFGAIIGVINATIINSTNLPPFIVTLAMQKIIRGIGYIVTNGSPVQLINDNFKFLGSGYFLGIPVPVCVVIVITIVLIILLNQTKFGRHVYAVGGNIEAAKFSGVKIGKIRVSVYVISGICAAIAGILLAARMYSGQPELATGYESDAIAASVLGGVRFTGGCGTIGGAILGSIMMAVLNNGMNLLGFPKYVQTIIQGAVILIAVIIDSYKRSKK